MGKRGWTILGVSVLIAGACMAQADRLPNVVLILADDLGYNDISLLGNTLSRTQVQELLAIFE